ncbi:hypothetical protein A2851_00090 [Candidatus Kaiserbacteria bacterium RIFCSPHIGHO2_01_FULL_53_29]|uniref:HTH arsR-type domain-containing protein n=1 Tax=Candidatus Kaiserbacteria bacterium RIFCSPHIGHO2_01_FULL_53_29 TaxID=1798480 RepID=A0A1F6CW20_9BACT|nr:MAG: hypothetical protein A2851_00090 [Candidatus Kaiserbacteria bacterium RIFCSPHIGHO2_01_FULL_53_29]
MADDPVDASPSEPTPLDSAPSSSSQPSPQATAGTAGQASSPQAEVQPPTILEPVVAEAPPVITESGANEPPETPEVATPEVKPPEKFPETDASGASASVVEVKPPQEYSAPSPSIPNTASIPIVDNAARARAYASVVKKREERLARIIRLVQKEGKICNADIVRLLHVSDASASRYLRELVSRGTLVREGRGRGIRYVLVS